MTDPTPLDLDALESGLAASGNSIGPWYSLPRDDLRALIAELRRLRAAGEWVACSERMPEPREHVLAYEANALGIQAAIRFKDNAFETLDGVALENVTHWRPLPSPPVVQT